MRKPANQCCYSANARGPVLEQGRGAVCLLYGLRCYLFNRVQTPLRAAHAGKINTALPDAVWAFFMKLPWKHPHKARERYFKIKINAVGKYPQIQGFQMDSLQTTLQLYLSSTLLCVQSLPSPLLSVELIPRVRQDMLKNGKARLIA